MNLLLCHMCVCLQRASHYGLPFVCLPVITLQLVYKIVLRYFVDGKPRHKIGAPSPQIPELIRMQSLKAKVYYSTGSDYCQGSYCYYCSETLLEI